MLLHALLALLLIALPRLEALLRDARLDPRARAAARTLNAEPGAVTPGTPMNPALARGELDVFVRGRASRQALESIGARVRTSLPGLCTAFVPLEALERLLGLAGVESVRLAAPAEPELSASVPTTGVTLLRGVGPGFTGWNGRGVLVASVDTGVDFGHGDFRDSSGATRFVAIWDQLAPGPGSPTYPYGRHWTGAEIDAGICTEADSVGHGTHVIGIAAGDGSQTGGATPAYTHAGMAPRADLALVKTNFTDAGVLDGVKWLFDLAAARGECAVVNLSLGTQYGPHDGSSEFEQGLAALTGPGRIVVKSAGNDRGVARHASTYATPAGATVTLSVTGSSLGRAVAIDGYFEASERLRVRITTPGGTIIGPVAINGENAPYPGVSTPNGTVYAAIDSLPSGRRNVYLEVNALAAGQMMNGTWSFTFLADQTGVTGGLVDLWRFFSSSGLTANFVAGNQPARELISEPGNAPSVITVGSYVTRPSWIACSGAASAFTGTPQSGFLSTFSSPGPTRDGRLKPDLVAPGEAILSTTSFDLSAVCPASGTPSIYADDGANHTAMRGTSMSAPHVTGAIAVLLQKRGALTPAEVLTYLASHARRDAITGPAASNDWGAGKLDLGDLMDPEIVTLTRSPSGDVSIGSPLGLTWTTRDSLGAVASVDVQISRTGPDGPFETVLAGAAPNGHYDWTVTAPATAPGDAYVRAVAHDTNANTATRTQPTGFRIQGALSVPPTSDLAFALGEARPNPASGPVRIPFSLARAAQVRVAIRDIAGRRVAVLAEGQYPAGRFESSWNPTRRAPAGLYFIDYETPQARFTRRIVVTH